MNPGPHPAPGRPARHSHRRALGARLDVVGIGSRWHRPAGARHEGGWGGWARTSRLAAAAGVAGVAVLAVVVTGWTPGSIGVVAGAVTALAAMAALARGGG